VTPCSWADKWFDVPKNSIDFGDTKFIKLKITPKHTDIEIEVYLQVLTLQYGVDIDFDGLVPYAKNVYAAVTAKTEANIKVGKSHNFNTDKDDLLYKYFDNFTIGSLPILGADGIGFLVELDFVYEIEGSVELGIRVDATVGTQYINNVRRKLHQFDPEITPKLAAQLKAGLELGLVAEFLDRDLVQVGVSVGYVTQGSLTFRSGGIICGDLKGYVYLDLEFMKDTELSKWLDCAVTLSVWDENNTVFKQVPQHWENFETVEECTYDENGILTGKVVNASNKSQCIENAHVDIYKVSSDEETVTTVYTDVNGQYKVELPDGIYQIIISADGYIPFECTYYVAKGQTVHVETFLMVEGSEDSDATGTIFGAIKNSVTGYYVQNVELIIRKGWANTAGDDIIATGKTSSSGQYNICLPIGNYTVLMRKEGYVTNYMNVAVTDSMHIEYNGVITPSGDSEIPVGDLRVVLTWGSTPRDLDSHMFGPTANGSGEFHVYFSEKRYYYGGTTHCFLDVDDTTSYGPETVTVYSMENSGVYHYYVHDYTNKNSGSSKAMSNSDAKVQVYIGDQMVMSFNIPVDQAGTIWHVFDYDSEFGIITPVNTISNSYDH
jgi:hypothetical protein